MNDNDMLNNSLAASHTLALTNRIESLINELLVDHNISLLDQNYNIYNLKDKVKLYVTVKEEN